MSLSFRVSLVVGLFLFICSNLVYSQESGLDNSPTLKLTESEVESIINTTEVISEVDDNSGDSPFDFEQGLQSIANYIEENPSLMQGYDEKLGIIDPSNGLRLDLFIYDYIDELTHHFNKRKLRKYRDQFERKIGDRPIENFPKLYKFLKETAQTDEHLLDKLKEIVPQLYTFNGRALPVERKLLKSGQVKRLNKVRRINRYNKIAFDPEATNILRYLRDQEIHQGYHTPGLTVSKFRKLKRSRLKNLVGAFREGYHEAFDNGYLAKDLPVLNLKLKRRGDHKRSNLYLRKTSGAEDIVKKQVIPLFNEIHKRSDKYEIFNLIEVALGEELPKMGFYGRRFPVLTPGILYSNLEAIKVVLSRHTWEVAIDAGSDQVLQKLRKWMKENREAIEANIDVPVYLAADSSFRWRKGKYPSRALTLEMFDDLQQAFPDSPWVKGNTFYDENGERVILSSNKFRRMIISMGREIKDTFSIRGLLSIASASVVMALTGNPLASSAAGSLTYDMLYARKYGYRFARYMKNRALGNLATTVIFAAGFQSGKTARAIFLGGVSGLGQAALTGHSLRTGFIVGGIFDGVLAQLPPSVTKWVVPGEDKIVQNALLEVAEKAFFSGLKGGIMSYVDNQSIVDGIVNGALYGALVDAIPKMLFYGTRYAADELVTDAEIAEWNDLHNNRFGCRRTNQAGQCTSVSYVMRDRYGDDFEVNLVRDDLERYTYRKGGFYWVLNKGTTIGLYNPIDGQITMRPGYEGQKSTIIHEAGHAKQAEVAGYFYFISGVIPGISDFLHGETINKYLWEEYIYLEGVMLPDTYKQQLIAIPVLRQNGIKE